MTPQWANTVIGTTIATVAILIVVTYRGSDPQGIVFAGIYSAASAVYASERQQEAIAQNLAHVNVPGYRRIHAHFKTIDGVDSSAAFNLQSSAVGDDTTHVGARSEFSIDFRPGMIQQTGRSLDVALDGPGFIVVDTPAGEGYTRDGVLHLAEDGQIVDSSGYPIPGAGTAPPNVTLSDIAIGAEGQITANGQRIGQLRIVEFPDISQLQAYGPTIFRSAVPPADAENTTVQQGARELANVHATDELIRMMIGMRHHEAADRSIRSMSEALREHIRGGK